MSAARRDDHSWRPDPFFTALIRAGTEADTDTAAACWRGALALRPLSEFGIWAYPFLPLIHHRLAGFPDLPDADLLKRQHQKTWAHNQYLIAHATLIIGLVAAGIPCVLLKGAALQATVYPPGTRSMSDIDILVPLDRAAAAIEILTSAGLVTSAKSVFGPGSTASYHSMGFYDPHQPTWSLDLHWRPGCEPRASTASDVWAKIRRLPDAIQPFGPDISLQVLHPEDQLLHVITHGLRRNVASSCRWVLDCLMILQVLGHEIDGKRLASQARHRGVLRSVIGAADVLAAFGVERCALLGSTPPRPSLVDRVAHHARTAVVNRRSSPLNRLVIDYIYGTHGRSWRERLRAYPAYVRALMEADSFLATFRNLTRFAITGPRAIHGIRAASGTAAADSRLDRGAL